MPPPPSGSLDFNPILTHYVHLLVTIVAVVGWFVAFAGQVALEVHFSANAGSAAGVLWFAIWLELAFILGVLYTLASDSIALHRFQISTFGAVALVFSVIGVDKGIYSSLGSAIAMSVGWLLLSFVNILWVLYFTSEDDSLALHLFNSMGTGGLTPPSRRRRATRPPSMGPTSNGYASPYSGAGAGGMGPYDAKMAPIGGPVSMGGGPGSAVGSSAGGVSGAGGGDGMGPGSAGGYATSAADARSLRSMNRPVSDVSAQPMHSPPLGASDSNAGPSSPLMGGTAGVGAAGGLPGATSPGDTSGHLSGVTADTEHPVYRAKALYAYTASPDDPNEISFNKGEIMDILDKNGKWWQARKGTGQVGIAPSNYLQII